MRGALPSVTGCFSSMTSFSSLALINLVGATFGSSLAMTGAGVLTREAEEAGAEPGTAGTGLNPEGIRRLLTELSAWLSVTEMPDDRAALDKSVVSGFPDPGTAAITGKRLMSIDK